MPTKQEYVRNRAEQNFLDSYRELIAHFDGSKISESLVAYLQLNNESELNIDNPNYGRLLEVALVSLIDRGALTPIAPLNALAQADLQRLRKSTGVGYVVPAPPPPPAPTAAELLDQRVIADWASLKAADFRKNCANDRAYRAAFDNLCATGRLGGNAITSAVVAGA